jgi:hypothetical protein
MLRAPEAFPDGRGDVSPFTSAGKPGGGLVHRFETACHQQLPIGQQSGRVRLATEALSLRILALLDGIDEIQSFCPSQASGNRAKLIFS